MSKEQIACPYKQRFKGIENFLRRVAFNLGNTPSQTEVKIISCIPIDITDLQQRILSLERELQEAQAACEQNAQLISDPCRHAQLRQPTPIVQAAVGITTPNRSRSKNLMAYRSQTKVPLVNNACNTKCRKSNISFNIDRKPECSGKRMDENREIYEPINVTSRTLQERVGNRIVPKKFKRALKRRMRNKTHVQVYYAQTHTPFNSNDITSESIRQVTNTTDEAPISRTYLNNMIRKQYTPELIIGELTDISQYSTPVCRDASRNNTQYESNITYFNQIQSVDKCYHKSLHFDTDLERSLVVDPGPVTIMQQQNGNNNNMFYDAEHYDMVPVKEKAMKSKREDNLTKQPKCHVDITCCVPENIRYKAKFLPFMFHTDNMYKQQSPQIYVNPDNEYFVRNIKKRKIPKIINKSLGLAISKVCSVDCGDIYTKRTTPKSRKATQNFPIVKNAECITINTQNAECQTVQSKAVQNSISRNNNKAEVALDQIKSILQSVITEVKSNMKTKDTVRKPKRDVILQKGTSHSNIARGSTLLSSYTYNPSFNINPCLASFSRQIPNIYCPNLPYSPVKYMPPFPQLIKHKECGCQHKDNEQEVKSENIKSVVTTATNTDDRESINQAKVTNALIKEIYKSIALNLISSNKNPSNTELVNSKSINKFDTKSEYSGINTNDPKTVKQIDSNIDTEEPTNIITSINTTNSDSNFGPAQTTTQSEQITTIFEQKESELTTDSYTEDKASHFSQQPENEMSDEDDEVNDQIDDETEVYSTETLSEHTVMPYVESIKKKEKQGLIQKVLKSVNIFKRKRNQLQYWNEIRGSEVESSETENTESKTVYSYKSYMSAKPSQTQLNQMARGDRTIRKNQEFTRSPYMEQEYRRYWDEKLMFHENESRIHSSERSNPGEFSPRSPVFWRGYEAGGVMLGRKQIMIEQQNTPRILQRERTGLKLEWPKKQKFKPPLERYEM